MRKAAIKLNCGKCPTDPISPADPIDPIDALRNPIPGTRYPIDPFGCGYAVLRSFAAEVVLL